MKDTEKLEKRLEELQKERNEKLKKDKQIVEEMMTNEQKRLQSEKERKKFLSLAVVLAGTATAFAGNIGFLGLIAPHIAKKLVGPYHKKFISVSAMISIVIVLIADAVSRNLFSPIEIPVGITVSIFGVPYFIYLMMKEK